MQKKIILMMIISIVAVLIIGCSVNKIEKSDLSEKTQISTKESNNDQKPIESNPLEKLNIIDSSCDNDVDCSNNQVCENSECVELTPEIECERKNRFWCEESSTCHLVFGIYCEQCLEKEIDWCTCRDDKTGELKEDGEGCFTPSVKEGEDGIMMGKCFDRICEATINWVNPEGNIDIGIIEFEQKGLDYSYLKDCNGNLQDDLQPCEGDKEYDYLDLINNKNGVTNVDFGSGTRRVHSFYFIENWFEEQADNYNTNLDIDVEILGPFSLSEEPPRAFDYPAKNYLHQFFKNQAKENNIDLDSYDIVVFVHFYDINDERKFHTHHTSPGTDYVSASNSIWSVVNENILTTVMHEISHSFGAAEGYSGWEGCKSDYISNERHMACIMCGSCPDNDCGWDENGADALALQSKICEPTAIEFEWI